MLDKNLRKYKSESAGRKFESWVYLDKGRIYENEVGNRPNLSRFDT
jgi:hypothetical protein